MKKVQSTIWLDLLTYIILPLIILGSTWNIINIIPKMEWKVYTVVMMGIEISLLLFYIFIVYHSHKRTALAPKLLRALFWVTAIQAGFEYANTQHINKGYNLFLVFGIYFVICYIVWIRTNEVYIEKRKDIFGKNNTLKKNYRCEKCKRLVPIGKDCPHCSQEKIENKQEKESKKEKKENKESEKESNKSSDKKTSKKDE